MTHAPTYMLQIPNVHVASCGSPQFPDGLFAKASPWFVSYFENKHGEQWVFLYDRKSDKPPLVYGGDCGWEKPMQPLLCRVADLGEALKQANADGFTGQFMLAGLHSVKQILGTDTQPLLTMLRSSTGFITINGPEAVWLHACMLSAGLETPTPLDELTKHVADLVARAAAADDADDEDDADEDDDEEQG